mgnify:CR=1 FL=1
MDHNGPAPAGGRKGIPMSMNWPQLAADLERLLKLRSVVFGMKLYETEAEMLRIPKLRRPKAVHTLDQVVAQTARLGWTVGVTADESRTVGANRELAVLSSYEMKVEAAHTITIGASMKTTKKAWNSSASGPLRLMGGPRARPRA